LHLRRQSDPSLAIAVTALLQQRIIELARHVEHDRQRGGLARRWVEANTPDAFHISRA
jgi:hypothetical protein